MPTIFLVPLALGTEDIVVKEKGKNPCAQRASTLEDPFTRLRRV